MSVRNLKPDMYCTPIDVRKHNQSLTSDVITDAQLEAFIYEATSEVNLHLYNNYTANSVVTTPYCGISVRDEANSTNAVMFYGASAGASARTEMFTLSCATSSFQIKGNLQGVIGTTYTYASTVSATDISFTGSSWSGTPTSGNKFYIPIYRVYPTIVHITAKLAAAYALASKYTEDIPNANFWSNRLMAEVKIILNRIDDPTKKDVLAFNTSARFDLDIDPIAVSYNIDSDGDDQTDYYPDTPDTEGED